MTDIFRPQHDLDAQKQGRAIRRSATPRSVEITPKGYRELAKLDRKGEIAYQFRKEREERDREFFALGYDAGFKHAALAARGILP